MCITYELLVSTALIFWSALLWSVMSVIPQVKGFKIHLIRYCTDSRSLSYPMQVLSQEKVNFFCEVVIILAIKVPHFFLMCICLLVNTILSHWCILRYLQNILRTPFWNWCRLESNKILHFKEVSERCLSSKNASH